MYSMYRMTPSLRTLHLNISEPAINMRRKRFLSPREDTPLVDKELAAKQVLIDHSMDFTRGIDEWLMDHHTPVKSPTRSRPTNTTQNSFYRAKDL